MEIPEAKSLRWLAVQFPLVEKPQNDIDKMQSLIHIYCTAGANRLESMAEAIDFAKTIDAENVKLKAALEKAKAERDAAFSDIQRCCATCALSSVNSEMGVLCPWFDDCNQVDGDHWEWRGAKDTNVPSKEEE